MPVREQPDHPLREFPPDLTFPAGHEYAPGPVPRRWFRGLWLAIVLVILVVLGAVGAVGYLTYRLIDQTGDNARMADRTRVVEPAKLGTLAKGKDAAVTELVSGLKERMPAEFGAETTSSVLAGYGSVEQRDVVVVIAFSTFIDRPQEALDSMLRGMTSESAVLVRIDPGPLGGFAKCSNDKTNGVPSAFCAWADSGSAGVLIFFGKPFDDKLKERFVAARGQIEQREP